jgi:hypothetical protein
MVEEMESLDKNEAWDLVEFSTGRKLIGNKWVDTMRIKNTIWTCVSDEGLRYTGKPLGLTLIHSSKM